MEKNISKRIKIIFNYTRSTPRFLISMVIGLLVYLIIRPSAVSNLTHLMIGWDAFSLCMLLMSWITFFITDAGETIPQAKKQDQKRPVIFILSLASIFIGFLAVFLLLATKYETKTETNITVTVAIIGMIFSWFLFHTIFTLRYAHLYYYDNPDTPKVEIGGLKFPEENRPDFLDFAYYSFVIGMTFQVSDVDITSSQMRHLTLMHSILSFFYNTIIVALTINVIVSLKGA